jgi:hypothetical protein
MGYDVHITRKRDWLDDAPEITLGEWLSFVSRDPEMRFDGFADATFPDGSVLRTESPGLSVWIAYSGNGRDGNMAWFDHSQGDIVVANPDREILRKMWLVAQAFNAKVQGDDREIYDANGDIIPER